jgi:hypothetical protein
MSELAEQNFDQVWRVYGLDKRLKTVRQLFDMPRAARARLLRDHREEGISSPKEWKFRDALDFALHGASMLEIGFAAGVLADPRRRVEARIVPLLKLPEVRTYFEDHYPILLPSQLLLRYHPAAGPTRSTEPELSWFGSLLAMDARFHDDQMDIFLSIVDGYVFEDDDVEIDFAAIRRAAKSPKRLIRAVMRKRPERSALDYALAGLERFILFSSDLTELLAAPVRPALADAAFNLYRYWYAARSKELGKATQDAIVALSERNETFASDHAAVMQALFDRAAA